MNQISNPIVGIFIPANPWRPWTPITMSRDHLLADAYAALHCTTVEVIRPHEDAARILRALSDLDQDLVLLGDEQARCRDCYEPNFRTSLLFVWPYPLAGDMILLANTNSEFGFTDIDVDWFDHYASEPVTTVNEL